MRSKHPYPLFLSEAHRDQYLDAAIGRGKQVQATSVYIEGQRVFIADLMVPRIGSSVSGVGGRKQFTGELFTVEKIDKRKGK